MEQGKVFCMNGVCSNANASVQIQEWIKGWPLHSTTGRFATLCHKCGTAYKELIFCETFHSEDTGWRECTSCGKRLHCGCIASSSSLVLLDTGGIICLGCSNISKLPLTQSQEKLITLGLSKENGACQKVDTVVFSQTDDDAEDCEKFHGVDSLQTKLSGDISALGELGQQMSMNFSQTCIGPSRNDDTFQGRMIGKNVHESLVQTNLSIGVSASSGLNPFSMAITKEKETTCAISPTQLGPRPYHLLPKISNSVLAAGLETTKSRTISPVRVARPPIEGRVKNQLLPRYWPRITDQELQQISGDSNSTIIPLFEKVLSASDAGRIGRLVLPKACAEAYFPPISQPEGLPLRIQDVKGKEWLFQFRFWPNNNSRMYVLEGVTPCIQSMQLQAGDTVTFSRMDPEGKLLMGFRKASTSVPVQDSSLHSGTFSGDPLLAAAENLHVMNGYSGLFQTLKGNRNSSTSLFQKPVYPGTAGSISHQINEKSLSRLSENNLAQPLQLPERKRSRNIGPKSKRLLMDDDDALELKLSWDELQDLLCSPLSVEPSTIDVEDHEFEEFEEPPVFGKRSIFIVRLSGEQEQWAQCDSCLKWRKVPYNLPLPPKWTCQDNSKDRTRSSCSAPDELTSQELENLLKLNKEIKRRRLETSLKLMHGQEPQEHEVSENAIAVGGDLSEPGSSSAATTTKHPRHRPGCSCIVCIQPPSGKGKHKPTCTCNVCMTVKRRFKTLMMRKQKRQSEREAETAQQNQLFHGTAAKEEAGPHSVPDQASASQIDCTDITRSENELSFRPNENKQQPEENSQTLSVKLDLNCCPDREANTAPLRISMMSLVQEASLPLETYLRQNGLTSLVSEQQPTLSHTLPRRPEESQNPAADQEESDELSGKDQGEDDEF